MTIELTDAVKALYQRHLPPSGRRACLLSSRHWLLACGPKPKLSLHTRQQRSSAWVPYCLH